ncbi:hypothetical protein DFS34DRAFT_654488 [Phlyctochytrium arcticum]|nr:hypothetical protein DFS34DRAFT_654488 [Phlyctochytrium arcticum]
MRTTIDTKPKLQLFGLEDVNEDGDIPESDGEESEDDMKSGYATFLKVSSGIGGSHIDDGNEEDAPDPSANFPARPTTIEVYDRTFRDTQWVAPTPTQTALPLVPCPTIGEVSRHVGLNEEQHTVFVAYAKALIGGFAALDEIPPSALAFPTEQQIGSRFGEAGTGKSYVIKALRTLANKWGRPEAVKSTAYTGIAASNAGGVHLH